MLFIPLILQLYLITPYYRCRNLTLVVLSFNYNIPLGTIYLGVSIVDMPLVQSLMHLFLLLCPILTNRS